MGFASGQKQGIFIFSKISWVHPDPAEWGTSNSYPGDKVVEFEDYARPSKRA